MDFNSSPYQQMGASAMPGMSSQPMPGAPGQPGAPAEKDSKKKGKDGKPVTKKVVNRQFVIAVLFALLATVAVLVVNHGSKPAGQFVVVAAGPIATNTPVDVTLLKAVQVPDSLVEPGAITAPTGEAALASAATALNSVRSQFPITANQQIIPEQFGLVVNLGTPLGADERLVSFRATVAAAVSGSIKPGDHVDVFAASGDLAGPVALNVPIVSVTVSEDRYNSVADAQTGDKNARPTDLLPGDPVPGTYVVRVKADLVGKIISADNSGKIYLVYRDAKATDTSVPATTTKEAICSLSPSAVACR